MSIIFWIWSTGQCGSIKWRAICSLTYWDRWHDLRVRPDRVVMLGCSFLPPSQVCSISTCLSSSWEMGVPYQAPGQIYEDTTPPVWSFLPRYLTYYALPYSPIIQPPSYMGIKCWSQTWQIAKKYTNPNL